MSHPNRFPTFSPTRKLRLASKSRRQRRQRLLPTGFEQLESRSMLAVTFNFNYVKNEPGVGFDHPDTALVDVRKAALEDAAATFGSWFTQTATLTINVEDFHDGPLDSNAFPEISVANTDPGFVRTVPETKIQTGVDPNGAAADGVLFLNWEEGNPDVQAGSPKWNYTDTIGANEMDFKGEVIHNLAHILGFQSRITQVGEDIFNDPLVHLPGEPGTWVTFDKFVSTASGTTLINATDFKLNILEWSTSSTAGSQPEAGLFFNGEHAKAANGGNPVPLYSPNVFVPDGTASHLRPSATVNRSNTLMIAAEPGTQNVGPQARQFTPVEIGIMRDLGYEFNTPPRPVGNGIFSIAEDPAAPQEIAASSVFDPGPTNESSQTVALEIVSQPTPEGTAVIQNGSLRFTPTANFSGTVNVVVRGVDNGTPVATSADRTLTINVTPVNDAPDAVNDDLSVLGISAPQTLDVLANDNPGPRESGIDTIRVTAVTQPSIGTVSIGTNGADVIFTPPDDVFDQRVAFSYTITDGGNLTDTATVEVYIAPPGRPFALDDTFQVAEDSAVSPLDVLGNDFVRTGANGILNSIASVPSGQAPVIPAAQGTLAVVGNLIDFTPTANFFGQVALFTYSMNDDSGESPENGSRQVATVTVIVTEVNDAPVATPIDRGNVVASIRNEFDLTETLSTMSRGAANESGQTLRIVSVGSSTLGVQPEISSDGLKIFYTAPLDASGADSFTYTVEDNGTTNGVADVKRSTSSVSLSISPFSSGSFSGFVYVDEDRNNQKDVGDRAIGGVNVFMYEGTPSNAPPRSQWNHKVTDAQGRYRFENLPLGTFTVEFSVPSLMVDSAQPNFITRTIAATGEVNFQQDFAVLGVSPGYRSVLENLASNYYLTDQTLRNAGIIAQIAPDGKSDWTVGLDTFRDDTFYEVVLSDDNRSAYVTAVRGSSNEVFSTTLDRSKFVAVNQPDGSKLVRVIAKSSELTWTKINLAAPPVLPARKFLAAIDEFLGTGNVVLNPSTTIAPVILVSKNGQPPVSLSVTASGGTNTFDVVLNAPPVNGNVVLSVLPASATHLQVTSPAGPASTLTFNATNWHIPQTVTVKGKSDGTPQVLNHQTNIIIALNATATTASNYAAALPQTVSVTTIDDVGPGTIVATGVSGISGALSIGDNVIALPRELGTLANGVSVATGDLTGDGVMDYVLGSSTGAQALYAVLDGETRQIIRAGQPYPGFLGGVHVAVGDVNGDGKSDIITATAAVIGHVKVFDGHSGAEIRSFLTFPSGATVASGDVDGDGFADIVVGAGPGAGPLVKVFSGRTGAELLSFFAYTSAFTGGVFVAAGDLNGDGKADIVTGAGAGAPHVKAFDGVTAAEIASLIAFPESFTGGVRVAVDANSRSIVAGMGPGGSTINKYSSDGQLLSSSTPFGLSTSGVSVAVANTSVTQRTLDPEIRALPGITLARDANEAFVTNSSTLSLIVDFGGAVTSFAATDLQVSGGTISNFRPTDGNGGLYRFDVTPGPSGVVEINIPASAATGTGGIATAALTTPFKIRFDTVGPSPRLELPPTTNDASIQGVITFNESVFSHDASKLTATNGAITNFTRTGEASFSFTLTPTVRGQPTGVNVAANFVRDLAGNFSASLQSSTTFADTTVPALIPKLSSFESTSTTLASVPFTVDFGTPVNGLTETTPLITNGSVVGEVQHQGNGVYAFIVKPTAPGAMTVSIPANRVTDAANAARQNVASETISLQFSATAPKPEIFVTGTSGLMNGGTTTLTAIPFQVVFSAPVDGFLAEDIQIIGGTIANFAGEDSQPVYTFDVIPNGSGQISLSIPAGVAKDVDQIDNLASAPFNFQSNAAGDVTVTVQSDPSTARAGADIFYLVSVKNQGLGTVSNVSVTATLPADMTFVPIADFLADTRVSASGQNLSINVGDLPAAAERFFTVQVKLNQNAAVNSAQSITFNVTGTNDDSPANNSATIAKTVIPAVTAPITSATVKDVATGLDVMVTVPADSGANISNLVSTPILSVPALVEAAAIPVGVNISATSFNVNLAQGGTVVVTLRPPGGVPPNATFMKYGKLPGGTVPTVYPFLFDGDVGAKLFPDRIEIHLKDGAKGDNDGIANGVIVDPGFVTALNPFAPFQSTTNSLDVDGNGSVAPLDALLVINELNRNGSYTLPSVVPMPVESFLFLDTSGDGLLSPVDALLVINDLNRTASGEEPEPTEDAQVAATSSAPATFVGNSLETLQDLALAPTLADAVPPASPANLSAQVGSPALAHRLLPSATDSEEDSTEALATDEVFSTQSWCANLKLPNLDAFED